MRDVHMLHHTQSVPMLDETSALHGNVPQRNDEEGGKQPRLYFSPAASVWGQMGRAWTTGGRNAPRTTESITETDYVACDEGAWDHINSYLHHASNWTCAHDHVLRALERICNDAGFATTHKRVLTSEGNRRADLEIRNIRVPQQANLLVDVTVRHNFIGAGHIGQTQGQLRIPDNPDHILESAATRSATIATGMWLSCRRACLPRAASTASSCAMACAQAVALRSAPTTARRHVAAPRRPPPLHMAYDDHDRNVSHIHGFAQDSPRTCN